MNSPKIVTCCTLLLMAIYSFNIVIFRQGDAQWYKAEFFWLILVEHGKSAHNSKLYNPVMAFSLQFLMLLGLGICDLNYCSLVSEDLGGWVSRFMYLFRSGVLKKSKI